MLKQTSYYSLKKLVLIKEHIHNLSTYTDKVFAIINLPDKSKFTNEKETGCTEILRFSNRIARLQSVALRRQYPWWGPSRGHAWRCGSTWPPLASWSNDPPRPSAARTRGSLAPAELPPRDLRWKKYPNDVNRILQR